MKVQCGNCGARADVSLTPNGFTYEIEARLILTCPVMKQRREQVPPSSTDTDCEHMMRAAQATAQKMRGR